jgi:WD40 repeat protein
VMDASPDGRTLAVDADHDVRLLDAATGHLRRTLHGHDEDVLGLRFSADGELLASAAGDGLAIVWDAQTGAVREQLSVAETNVYGLVFSPDDRTLYTAGYDHVIRRWDLTGRSLYISRVVPPRRVRVRLRRPGPRR